jgi:hypothetical protein
MRVPLLGETISTSLAEHFAAEAFVMTKENDLHGVIDLIYEAVLDDTLWPKALTRLADAMGTAQIASLKYRHGRAIPARRANPRLFAKDGSRRHGGAHAG